MDKKLAALYGYHCQMVLTVDDFVQAARAAGADENKLANIDALNFRPHIQAAMHARNGALGAQMGTVYAEAFRYEREEAPDILNTTAE
jgi:hypothetical protein